jgi:hypothetical protein
MYLCVYIEPPGKRHFAKHVGLHRTSIHTPILNNHLFSPSCSDPAFRIWSVNGLVELNDLYEDGVFASFPSLSAKYNLPNSHLFRFFQIRHFVQKLFPHFPNRPLSHFRCRPETSNFSYLQLNKYT